MQLIQDLYFYITVHYLCSTQFESIDRIGEEFPIFIVPSDHQNNVEHVVLMLKNIIGPIFEIVCMPLRKEILMEKIKRNAALFDCLLAWQQEHDTL